MGHYKDLLAFKKAYELAIEIYKITKKFPADEKYSLIDQVRRSSRSVCVNLGEAYRRRKYKDYFVSKLTDCLSENCETEIWLCFAKDFGYLAAEEWQPLHAKNDEVGRLLKYMIDHPVNFM
jgi:four helix bundle protein